MAATIAPLLGLPGTVSGMIGAFAKFRLLGETGDPTVFAGDISKALITTEAGLVVAIPALALWHYFRNRTNTYADELESNLQELLVDFVAGSGRHRPDPAPAGDAAPAASDTKPKA